MRLCFGVLLLLGASSAAFAETTYQVQKGDTLFRIAFRHLHGRVHGKTGSYERLLAMNPEISDPKRLYIGQSIKLKEEEAPLAQTEQSYRVQKGDTLFRIAFRHLHGRVHGKNGSYERLLAMNPEITNPKRLHLGQEIRLTSTQSPESLAVEAKPEVANEVKIVDEVKPQPQKAKPVTKQIVKQVKVEQPVAEAEVRVPAKLESQEDSRAEFRLDEEMDAPKKPQTLIAQAKPKKKADSETEIPEFSDDVPEMSKSLEESLKNEQSDAIPKLAALLNYRVLPMKNGIPPSSSSHGRAHAVLYSLVTLETPNLIQSSKVWAKRGFVIDSVVTEERGTQPKLYELLHQFSDTTVLAPDLLHLASPENLSKLLAFSPESIVLVKERMMLVRKLKKIKEGETGESDSKVSGVFPSI